MGAIPYPDHRNTLETFVSRRESPELSKRSILNHLLTEEAGLGLLFALAFANGANDVGKSVASLLHIGPTGLTGRRPLLWGGFFSGVGSIAAIVVSTRLLATFTPQKIVNVSIDSLFVLAVLAATALWVLAATLVRLPVSTTHAILGAIMLQGIYRFGVSSLAWDFVAIHVLLPLAAGPLAALIGIYILERLIPHSQVVKEEKPRWAGLSHWGSAAATAFARGVNDAPKMAVLGGFFLVANSFEGVWVPYLIVAFAVLVGSMALGHRVAMTLRKRAFPLDHGQRFRAGVVTAVLVSAGAYLGAPLSTTHVHSGAAAGASGLKESIRTSLRAMVLPWLVTLPAVGLIAIMFAILGPSIFP
jgi:inorganic phosphate transporter, PiT family